MHQCHTDLRKFLLPGVDYYLGFGENFEALPLQNCIEPGEINSVWYVFSVATSGTLGFTINSSVDFDFALWDISVGGCQEIGQAAPIRCNYSGSNSPTGMTASTVAAGNLNYGDYSSHLMPGINAVAGQTFALWTNNLWLNPFTFSGYNINFSGSATLVGSLHLLRPLRSKPVISGSPLLSIPLPL